MNIEEKKSFFFIRWMYFFFYLRFGTLFVLYPSRQWNTDKRDDQENYINLKPVSLCSAKCNRYDIIHIKYRDRMKNDDEENETRSFLIIIMIICGFWIQSELKNERKSTKTNRKAMKYYHTKSKISKFQIHAPHTKRFNLNAINDKRARVPFQ